MPDRLSVDVDLNGKLGLVACGIVSRELVAAGTAEGLLGNRRLAVNEIYRCKLCFAVCCYLCYLELVKRLCTVYSNLKACEGIFLAERIYNAVVLVGVDCGGIDFRTVTTVPSDSA